MGHDDPGAPPRGRDAARARAYWLDTPDGRMPLGASAVLIGRSTDCNLIVDQPDVSRHHALVRVGEAGAELLPLGRLPVVVNGVERRELTPLRAGDCIDVRGWVFKLGESDERSSAPARGTVWCLERRSGLLHLVTGPTFRVGGGRGDDLVVAGWEPSVLSVSLTPEGASLRALRPGVSAGRALDVGEAVELHDGDVVAHRAERFVVRAKGFNAEALTAPSSHERRDTVVLEFLPRGGRLTLDIAGRVATVLLSERRCDLVACLLKPPPPLVAGDCVPEDALCARVWPGEDHGGAELNSLLYRLRQTLADEGVDAAPLFERVGGGLRICLAPDTRVVVR